MRNRVKTGIIEKEWQLNSLFKNIRDSAIMLILYREKSKK